MAQVLLIHPMIEMTNLSGESVNVRPQRYPPLGLAYLAAYLKKHNHQVEILDANALDYQASDAAYYALQQSPNIVGIFCNSFNLRQVTEIVNTLKCNKQMLTVLGGPHITDRPEALTVIKADYAIRGDGEEAILAIANHVDNKAILDDAPGLVRYLDGKIINPTASAVIKDLDALPLPARDLLPEHKYYTPAISGKMTTMVTVKGCTGRCDFCALPNIPYRSRSAENVLNEFQHLADSGYKYVDLHDPTFSFNMERARYILTQMLERKIKIAWGCETRADRIDRDLVFLMKKAGCNNIRFGIEAGNDRVRNEIVLKGISKEQIRKAFNLCKLAGIETMAFFMLGHPTETLAEMQETLDFCKELKPTYADFSIGIPIPGSKLFEHAVETGLLSHDIWEQVAGGAPIPLYIEKAISLEDIVALRQKAYRQQYINLRQVLTQLKSIHSISDAVNKFRAAISVLTTSQGKEPVVW